jgi:hypothetical protein
MTKWRSNRSIYNKDKSGIFPGAKFEFDDKDWAEVIVMLTSRTARAMNSKVRFIHTWCSASGPRKQNGEI